MFKKDKDVDLPKSEFKLIKPKRDFRIFHNSDDIQLVKGEEIEIPIKYIQNLKTEKVI